MSKTISAVVAAAMLAGGVIAMAAPTSVTGVLVDKGCYSSDRTAEDQKAMEECAVSCAKSGEPVALVTDKGDVYTVTGDLAANKNEKLVPHMSHKVTLTGEVTEAAGEKSIAATALKMISK